MPKLSLFLVLLLLAGCSLSNDDSFLAEYGLASGLHDLDTLEDYRAYLARVDNALDIAVGRARAEVVEQCAVLLYGSKACGGHSSSLVYSLRDGDPDAVVRLGRFYTSIESQMNRKFGLASDCAIAAIPRPILEDGQCVAVYGNQ